MRTNRCGALLSVCATLDHLDGWIAELEHQTVLLGHLSQLLFAVAAQVTIVTERGAGRRR